MRSFVVVTLQVEGFHCWPEAPEEVKFLRDNHRHLFHIRAVKEVAHGDRDVEIIMLKRALQRDLHACFVHPSSNDLVCEFGSMSCEHIAKHLFETHSLSYCQVLEDGENGGIVSV